jgi:NhaP-type Na+/H+ or K+/H+ antiporter
LEALLVGAILSPTDPILANSIVKGRFAESHVPLYLRTLLSAESAANDSFILPAIHILLMLIIEGRKRLVVPIFQIMSELIFNVIVWKIGGGLLVGVLMGHLSKSALMKAERYKYIDKESLVAFNFALALVTCSLALLIGVSDLLALFVTGLVFSWDSEVEDDESEFQNVIDALFNLSYFVMFGASFSLLVLWSEFGITRLIIFSLLVLVLRRLPIVVLLSTWIPQLKSPKEALFCGWFGPMGVGALFYSSYAVLLGCNPLIFQISSAVVLASVFAHGVTVPLFHLTTLHRTFSLLPPDKDEAAEILTTLLTESESERSLVLSAGTILDLREPLSGFNDHDVYA